MNQTKINLAIDERLDRIDAFYKKKNQSYYPISIVYKYNLYNFSYNI